MRFSIRRRAGEARRHLVPTAGSRHHWHNCLMTDEAGWPIRKRIRLPATAYGEPSRTWHVTLVIDGRDPVFAYLPLAPDVAALIRERCQAMATGLDLYCLMQDHAHLL